VDELLALVATQAGGGPGPFVHLLHEGSEAAPRSA
jgi:hypothetical protein